MKDKIFALLVLGVVMLGSEAMAFEFEDIRDIPYYSAAELAEKGAYAADKCKLDLRIPKGVTNFATVINIHGGGLVHGNKHFPVWPEEAKGKDPIAFVGVGYRLLTNATPQECIGDAAASVAWTLRHIAEYGGDPKKVFLTGISGGGYQTAMIGMDRKWLAPHGYKPSDLAGIAPLTGQVTKHFNVRAVSFRDTDPRYAPKIDEWAPLAFAGEPDLPPICLLTGGRRDREMPCRVEENEFLAISLKECKHRNVEFHETEGSHGGSVDPSKYFLRDFVMKYADADGVGRFAEGERVAFLGDSITHGGGYVSYLRLFNALRNPGSGTRIVNFGIGGDTASGGIKRLDWDVVKPFKPDRVFIMFGMNDVGGRLYATMEPVDAANAKERQRYLDNYAANEAKLVDMLQERKIKPVLITPTPYDQYNDFAKTNLVARNEPGLATCAEIVRKLAAERHLGLVEFHRPLTEIMKRHRDMHFCRDRVHPGNEGHLLMAAQLLDTMRFTPIVAQVSVDAKAKRVYPRANKEKLPETRNAVVSDLKCALGGVSFTYAPKALPFPALPEYVADEKYYPLTERFNREIFIVTGLADGDYEVAFDGKAVGKFAASELAKGVNVALLDTPNQLRAQEAAKVAEELRLLENVKRMYYLVVAKERNGNPEFREYRLKSYNDYKAKIESEMFREENLHERLNAVRPAVSRVTILPVKL